MAVLVAVAVGADGYREILAGCEGAKEDKGSRRNFLRHLKERGLQGVRLVISDKCLGLTEALSEFFPEAQWQRCVVHWYRNVLTAVPRGKAKAVSAMLKAIHAQEDREAALRRAEVVVSKLYLDMERLREQEQEEPPEAAETFTRTLRRAPEGARRIPFRFQGLPQNQMCAT